MVATGQRESGWQSSGEEQWRKGTPEGYTEWADKEGRECVGGGQVGWRDRSDWEKMKRGGVSSSRSSRTAVTCKVARPAESPGMMKTCQVQSDANDRAWCLNEEMENGGQVFGKGFGNTELCGVGV